MPKAIHLQPKTELYFVTMMLDGYEAMIGRRMADASALETLGMVATRMLFASGALNGPDMMEKAMLAAQGREIGMTPGLREDLEKLYGRADDFAQVGVTFHTEQ